MARYKVLELSFINNSLVQAGEVVEINDNPANGGFEPGSNLAPEVAEGGPRGRRRAVEDSSDIA